MSSTRCLTLAAGSLTILLAANATLTIAVAQPAVPSAANTKADDSGTMRRANTEMRRVLMKLGQLGAKPLGTQSVEVTRKGPTPADAVMTLLRDDGKDPVAMIGKLNVGKQDFTYPAGSGAQPLRVYTPDRQSGRPLPVIVYYHGGGWVIATIDTYESSAMALAKKTGAIVVSVEYRHAPENRFPSAHDDAIAAYKWVSQNAGQFGGDPGRLAVAGESAGGNLAINVAIMARDQNVAKPLHMLLVYPVAGVNMNTPSYRANEYAVPLSKAAMEWFVKNTIANPSDVNDPRLDLTGKANLAGLPPATVIGAEIDPLASEGKMLADKLRAAGVKTTYREYKGVTHEFFGMNAVVSDAENAQKLGAKELRTALFPDLTR